MERRKNLNDKFGFVEIMEYTSIGESCSVVSGGTPSRSKNEYWENGNIPWIKIGNIKSKYVNEYDELITEQGLNNSSAKLLKKGTILYTIFATLGEVGILDIEACTNQAIAGINITDPRITTDYLYYYLKSKKDYVNNIGRGVAQNNINLTTLKNFEIPLIDVDKQLNIVEILEKVERMICLKEKEIDDLDLLIKARFVEMFGDPATPGDKFKTCKLGEVADVKSSHRVFSTEFVNEGVPFYRGTEISVLASGQQPEDPYRISMDHYLKIANDDSKPIRGDLLLPSICNKGQVWMVNTDEPFYYKDGRVLCISPHRSIFDSRYLQFYMKMRTEAEYPKLGSGSTFAEFKIFQLKELLVDMPPMNAQKSFCLFADQVDKSREAVKKSLEKTQQLYDSLMQEYFG